MLPSNIEGNGCSAVKNLQKPKIAQLKPLTRELILKNAKFEATKHSIREHGSILFETCVLYLYMSVKSVNR